MRYRLTHAFHQAKALVLGWWGFVVGILITATCTALGVAFRPARSGWWWPAFWVLVGGFALAACAWIWSLIRFTSEWRQEIWEQPDHAYAQVCLYAADSTMHLADPQVHLITPSGIATGWLFRATRWNGPELNRLRARNGVSCRFPLAGQPLEVGLYKVMWRARTRKGGYRRQLSVERWNRDEVGEWHRV